MNQHLHPQWHKVVPEHAMEWEDGPEGGAVLLVPRFRKGPLSRWLQPRLRRPHIRVKLDEIGSFVWRAMDGQTAFVVIAARMREHFGERVEPAEDRLQRFLTVLYKDTFVKLLAPASQE